MKQLYHIFIEKFKTKDTLLKLSSVESLIKALKSIFPYCLIFVIAISVYFNIRISLNSNFSYILGEKKDFTINFLYLSDILATCLIPVLVKRYFYKSSLYKSSLSNSIPLAILILSTFSFLIQYNKLTLPIISIFYLLYIAKAVILHETTKLLSKRVKNFILLLIWIFGLIEAFISIIQFSYQAQLGLRLLGEPFFGPYMWGVAKVEALGQVFARPYGTYLHPNILSAFLLMSLIAGMYYYYSRRDNEHKISWGSLILIQINLFALFISFSRAAWLATALVFILVHIFTWNIYNKQRIKSLKANLIASAALLCLLLFIFQPFVKQRGNILDKAYQERRSYNQAALAMVADSPVIGMGPGESVLHMEQYLGLGTKPWEIQPIHNYYLLLAAEIGLPALILFLLYLAHQIKRSYQIIKNSSQTAAFQQAILLSGLIGCLVLMLFDHYFYTIQAAVILFWVWLALLSPETEQNKKSALLK